MMTHYGVLGVKEDATGKEIRDAYRRMAIYLHPDKNVGANEMVQRLVEDRFLEVQEAYATLSHDPKRKEYDGALGAYRSEGEYYIPAAPKGPPEQKEPARCDKCEDYRKKIAALGKEIAALEQKVAPLLKEVMARRQVGVTVCKLAPHSLGPSVASPVSGVCDRCWNNIADEVRKRDRRTWRMLVGFLFYCASVWLSATGHMGIILFGIMPFLFPWSLLKAEISRRKRYSGIWKPLAGLSFYLSWAIWQSATGHSKAVCLVTMALIALYLLIEKVTS